LTKEVVRLLRGPDNQAEVTVNARAFPTIDGLEQVLLEHAYVTDRVLATVLFLTLKLRKPLLLEGEAGVGKTQVAKTLAEVLDTRWSGTSSAKST
jgi:MoxR-like ATPase